MRVAVLLAALFAGVNAIPNPLEERAIVTVVETVVNVRYPNGQLYTVYTVGVPPKQTGAATTTKRITITSQRPTSTSKRTTSTPKATSKTTAKSTTPVRTSTAGATQPTGVVIPPYAQVDTTPTFANDAVDRHNLHRSNHSANAVTYNTTLARYALEKAVTCVFDESMPADAKGVGMNLALGTNNNAARIKSTISGLWYNDEFSNFPGYGIANPPLGNFENWGHFTQVVWKGSQQIGCAVAKCARNTGTSNQITSGYFIACMYSPPGNFLGQFNTGVGRPLGHPIAT